MRRTLVLAVLFGLMFSLHVLKVQPGGAGDPMVLAAIGFVLLASFTLAELGSNVGLPRVTGYILGGVALGPSAANVLSSGVVGEMRMFNTLALGLIATGAGLELDIKQIAKVIKTLAGTIVVKVLFGVGLVGGAFIAMQSGVGLLALDGNAELYAVALLMGVLSIGTSPAIALAIKTESGAKGRLTDLVLGAAIAKDIVVVVCLAVAIAVSRTWLSPGDAGGQAVFELLLKELGSSLLAGGILGLLLILYIRFVRAEMLLFVAAMILVVSEVGRTLHLELLLVFITAGFVVRNLSEYEHDLMPAVQMVALPVFVVFFTIAGAGVDLQTTWKILPLAGVLCFARAVAYWFAGRIGGGIGREDDIIRKKAWLGYLPQAGVTLGLVGLAAQQLPAVGEELSALGMAVVAINLLIGPVTLKRALQTAGEVQEVPVEEVAPATQKTAAQTEPEVAPRVPAASEKRRQFDDIVESVDAERLRKIIELLRSELSHQLSAFRAHTLVPWTHTIVASTRSAVGREDAEEQLDALIAWSKQPHTEDISQRAETCRALFQELRERLRNVAEETVVPLEEYNRRIASTDTFGLRWRKRRAALGRAFSFPRRLPQRRVPSRTIVRTELEPRLAALSTQVFAAWCRAHAQVIEELRGRATGVRSSEETVEDIRQRLDIFVSRFESDAHAVLIGGFQAAVPLLNLAGGPALPVAKIRFSRVEPKIKASLSRLDVDPLSWAKGLDAALARLRLHLSLGRLESKIERSLAGTVVAPASSALGAVQSVLSAARAQLQSIADAVPTQGNVEAEERERLAKECQLAYPLDAQRRLEAAAARYRTAASVHSVAREARLFVEELPLYVTIPHPSTPPERASAPEDIRLDRIPLRERVERLLVRDLFPALDEELQELFGQVAVTGSKIREAVDIFVHALSSQPELLDDEAHEELERAFQRGVARLDEQHGSLDEGRERTTTGIGARARGAFDQLERVAEVDVTRGAVAERLTERLGMHANRLLYPLVDRWQEVKQAALNAWQRIAGSQFSRDVQLRYRKEGVDASEIRELVGRWGDLKHVPANYARLFSPEPVREHRLFTANREALRTAIETERLCLEGGRGSALVVGVQGSGRTSLLNLCELEVSAPRVIRPDPLEWRRSVGVEQALAIELGLDTRKRPLHDALRDVKTTVLLDDLEQWFEPSARGIGALKRFLELVIRTDDQVFWLIAIERGTLELFEEVLPIRPAFARIIYLGDLEPSELATAIEGRHALSGRELRYPTTFLSGILTRLRATDDRSVYFRVLGGLSKGNLGAALFAWLRSVRIDDPGRVIPELNLGLSATLSVLTELPVSQLAALSQLVRFGPMNERELARTLALEESEARRHIHFLRAAGIVEPDRTTEDRLRINTQIYPVVCGALDQVGVLKWR